MPSSNSDGMQLSGYAWEVERDLLNSRIVALFLEALLFGAFLVTYTLGTWSLIFNTQSAVIPKRNKVLLGVNTLMLILALAHISLTVQFTLHGFVTIGGAGENVYDFFIESGLLWTHTLQAQFYFYVTQTLIGDGLMIYRLYVIWNGKRAVVIIPTILFLLDIASGYFYLALEFMLPIFYGMSFFTNTISSALIMWRVLRSKGPLVQDHWKWHSRTMFNFVQYRRVFEAIIESAAIYSTASVSLLVTMLVSVTKIMTSWYLRSHHAICTSLAYQPHSLQTTPHSLVSGY